MDRSCVMEKKNAPARYESVILQLLVKCCLINDKHELTFLVPPPTWTAGRCVHYGRAELKQSDHRPVVSVIEIEAFMVDERKRDKVFTEVVQQLGPPDATVILSSQDPSVFHEEDSDEMILRELSVCGQVILVRHVEHEFRVTFSDGLGALAACQLRTIQVGNHVVEISLKTKDWKNHLEKEMALCVNNTIPLLANGENNNLSSNCNQTYGNIHQHRIL